MVKITNGRDVFTVTKGAFENIYKKQGYKLHNGNEKPAQSKVPAKPEQTSDEKFIQAVMTKPISQWKKEEVKRFAKIKELDLSGTQNVTEAKEIVKKAIEDAEKELEQAGSQDDNSDGEDSNSDSEA